MLLITVGYVTITELKEGAMHDCEGVCYYQDQVVGLEGKTLVTSEVVVSISVSVCVCEKVHTTWRLHFVSWNFG